MRRALPLLLFALACLCAKEAPPAAAAPAGGPDPGKLRASIAAHLGRPYVRGAVGTKSFDCSGFVWRVMTDAGVLIKRTSARKLFLCLPETTGSGRYDFGNVVFFDDLAHCGIVRDAGGFYHAATSHGTILSPFSGYWKPKVCGFRRMPAP